MIRTLMQLWDQRPPENMANLPYRIRIVIGGIAGALPGTGKLLEGQIAAQITAGLKTALATEFEHLGIETSYLDAKLLSTHSRKRVWHGDKKTHTAIDIRVLLMYFIQNHESLIAQKVVGKQITSLMKPLLNLGKPIIQSQVDQLIETELHEQLSILLPQHVHAGLEQLGITVLEVELKRQ